MVHQEIQQVRDIVESEDDDKVKFRNLRQKITGSFFSLLRATHKQGISMKEVLESILKKGGTDADNIFAARWEAYSYMSTVHGDDKNFHDKAFWYGVRTLSKEKAETLKKETVDQFFKEENPRFQVCIQKFQTVQESFVFPEPLTRGLKFQSIRTLDQKLDDSLQEFVHVCKTSWAGLFDKEMLKDIKAGTVTDQYDPIDQFIVKEEHKTETEEEELDLISDKEPSKVNLGQKRVKRVDPVIQTVPLQKRRRD